VGIVDKSIVRPVLDAINAMRSSHRELAVYYGIVDVFCSRWMGKPRGAMNLEDEETIYLAHELLREYLRFEGNNKRVALWLLTINRCCRNYSADLARARREFARAVRGTDLDFDHTLLAPILQKANLFESRHSKASTVELGANDTMGSFYQWIGIYCTYVYPRLREDPHARDRSMVSTLAFLISEFISLKENVSRVAALLLAMKEACALGQPSVREGHPAGGAPDGIVAAGTETEIVEQILERLRAESRGESPAPETEVAAASEESKPEGRASSRADGPADRAGELEAAMLAAAADISAAEAGSLAGVMEDVRRWAGRESGRHPRAFRRAVEGLLSRETPRSREVAAGIAAGLRARPRELFNKLESRMGSSGAAGRGLLARLIVLALAQVGSEAGFPADSASG
jgi:hypothetical protein